MDGNPVPYHSPYFKLFNDIARRKDLAWNYKAVLTLLTHLQIEDLQNPVSLSYRTMASMLGMHRNTARRCARYLEMAGEIEILPRKKQADNNDYDCPREFRVLNATKRTIRRSLKEEKAIREGKLTPMVAR